MLRAGQLLPPEGLSTLGFDAGRFPPTPPACYRASWQLPGPDLHRLASTPLTAWVTSSCTTSSRQWPSTPRLLGTQKSG
jgi:hypothetical protein